MACKIIVEVAGGGAGGEGGEDMEFLGVLKK